MSKETGLGVLAVVFVILGLAATAGGLAISARFLIDERNVEETKAQMRRIAFSISRTRFAPRTQGQRQYEDDVGALPTLITDLTSKPGAVAACALDAPNQRVTGWCGPYLPTSYQGENLFTDAWGRSLVYSSAGRTLRSFGVNHIDDAGGGDDLIQAF